MFVTLTDHNEPVVDIVRPWFSWINAGWLNWVIASVVFAGISAAAAAVIGWAETPAYLAVLLSLMFAIGPFGRVYALARFAPIHYDIRIVSDETREPPSRRRFAMTALAQLLLLTVAVAGCWWYRGTGWDSVPLVDRWSPWTPILITAAPLVLVEWAALRQARRRELAHVRSLAAESIDPSRNMP